MDAMRLVPGSAEELHVSADRAEGWVVASWREAGTQTWRCVAWSRRPAVLGGRWSQDASATGASRAEAEMRAGYRSTQVAA